VTATRRLDPVSLTDPVSLLGDWALTRRLVDYRAGAHGTVRGTLSLRAITDRPSDAGGRSVRGEIDDEATLADEVATIEWLERGTLRWNGAQYPVTRGYRFQRGPDGWWLHFVDGAPFHAWRPGEWVRHPCRSDEYVGYVGSVQATGNSGDARRPGQWRVLWDVRGPEKRQRIVTRLCRPNLRARVVGRPGAERMP